ncbi:MAG: hypothetical protein NZ922_06355 [Candidatus Methanomethyliaceae archaeon]|nr:hypothetical protein [Candidatus Methanomethyliaceae archaeon]
MIKCSSCNKSLERIEDLEVVIGLIKKYDLCPFCGYEFNGKPRKIVIKSNGFS